MTLIFLFVFRDIEHTALSVYSIGNTGSILCLHVNVFRSEVLQQFFIKGADFRRIGRQIIRAEQNTALNG